MPDQIELSRPARNSASWVKSAAISADESAPSAADDGFEINEGNFICVSTSDYVGTFTDHSMIVWAMDVDEDWAIVAKFANLGADPQFREVAVQDFADGGRCALQLTDLAGGTSMKSKYKVI